MEEVEWRKGKRKIKGCNYITILKVIINEKEQGLNPVTNLFSFWMTCSERLKHSKMWQE